MTKTEEQERNLVQALDAMDNAKSVLLKAFGMHTGKDKSYHYGCAFGELSKAQDTTMRLLSKDTIERLKGQRAQTLLGTNVPSPPFALEGRAWCPKCKLHHSFHMQCPRGNRNDSDEVRQAENTSSDAPEGL